MELTADDIKVIREMRRWMQTNAQAGTARPQFTRKPPRMLLPVDKLYFYNNSGETAPAFGCLQVTGVTEIDNRYFLTAEKPSGNIGVFVFNSGSDVENAKTGVCHAGPFVRVLYDSGDSPTNGQVYGVDGFKARSFNSGKPLLNLVMLGVLDSSAKVAYALIEPMQQVLIKAPSGGIPGRVGTLLGSATCDVVTMATSNAQLATSSVQLTVFNWSTSVACKTGDRYGVAGLVNGRWEITAEDCGDAGSAIQAASTTSTTSQTSSDPVSASPTVLTSSPVTVYSFGNFHEIRFSSTSTGGGFE
jgi:hypothetical protein